MVSQDRAVAPFSPTISTPLPLFSLNLPLQQPQAEPGNAEHLDEKQNQPSHHPDVSPKYLELCAEKNKTF